MSEAALEASEHGGIRSIMLEKANERRFTVLKAKPMQFKDQHAVRYLAGVNSVRDGNIVGLFILPNDVRWGLAIQLRFIVPRRPDGNLYILTLIEEVKFDYSFTSKHSNDQIAFVKCLWAAEGRFYISLDPWKESEDFISDQDNDWFQSKSVTLTVERTSAAG